ncbi:hypothetical protein PVAND_007256 [Polypedilum vanderplanki]|uniref:Uncharacterized protein n=1 Tax=Polypedilum vanderplanki TaxID=319348 RepID=A0A9J6C6Q0_POLVA|nr:hypothetical protein PVAND_007256 [Polypedilum vanderplanki]
MYSYNRIHNDYDTNVVRVELNSSSYRPHTTAVISRAASREPLKITSSTTLHRNDTFTKGNNNNSGIVRSETFIVKHHENNSSDEHQHHQRYEPDYGTYTRSKKKSSRDSNEFKYDRDDDKQNYNTYTRKEKRGSNDEKSLYINTDTYRKLDKKRASLLSQESENLNVETFTKSSKPKRVESFIKKIEKNLWRRKDPKEPSPAPSSDKSDRESSTIKRSKNIFNLIASGKKSTREVEIQCKMDEDNDYYSGIAVRKSSLSLSPDHRHHHKKSSMRPLKSSQRYENGSNQRLTSIIKSSVDRNRNKTTSQQRRNNDHPHYEYENGNMNKKSSTPAPIRVEIDLRNSKNNQSNKYVESSNRKPIGIASPLPQPRSVLKSGTGKNYDSNSSNKKHNEISRNQPPQSSSRLQVESNFRRDEGERMSFREYREQLRAAKNENRKVPDTSDDDLRRSYQQSFFIPM